jgi:hypothetical protein
MEPVTHFAFFRVGGWRNRRFSFNPNAKNPRPARATHCRRH